MARCITAHVRATAAAHRISGKQLASRIGVSQNYTATRLRDEAPFTIDDVEAIAEAFELDPAEFFHRAYEEHSELVFSQELDQGLDQMDATGDERDTALKMKRKS